MSNATNKEIAFFTCSCEEGLLRVDYIEWQFDHHGIVDREFGVYFGVPCFLRIRDRLKMVWNMLLGRPVYYLTLKKKDAEVLAKWLAERSGEDNESR